MDSEKRHHSVRHGIGTFFAFLIALPSRFTAWLCDSFVGRCFHAYDKSTELLGESRLFRRFRESRVYRAASPMRYRVASALTNGPLSMLFTRILDILRYTETRIYGVMFGTFGLYTILVYVVRHFAFAAAGNDLGSLITGVATLFCSLLLLLSRKPLCVTLQESRILGFLLYRTAGLRRHPAGKHVRHTINPTVAFLLGSALGITGFFMQPLYLLLGILGIVLFFLLLFSPELCLFSAIAFAPFLIFVERPSILLCTVVLIGIVGYLLKVLLGKRLFSIEPLDFAVLFLTLSYLLSTAFTYGGEASVLRALACATLLGGGYFLTVNLFTSRALIIRAVNTLIISGTVVALIGLLQQFTGHAVADWLDSAAYDYISGRITSVFENPNILAVYLIMILPFVTVMLLRRGSPLRRLSAFFVFALFMAAIVYTWSRGAWIGVIASFALLMFACSPATIYLLLPVAAGIPLLLRWAASPIADRLSSAASLADSSVSYRFHLWRGTLDMIGDHILGGIGVGEEAFAAVYPYYAPAGIETARHAHNLYLEHLAEFGVVGLLLLLLFIFLFFQRTLTHQHEEENTEIRLFSVAAGCSVFAVLVNGLSDHVFYNSRIFFLFFVVVGIAVALARVGRTEHERSQPIEDNGGENYTIEVDIA
ncbi:MAG: O-antigen ligase family protein [Clostridia bacterium]|nr:O-antigen ligase family protein [Clostridia bacterium]